MISCRKFITNIKPCYLFHLQCPYVFYWITEDRRSIFQYSWRVSVLILDNWILVFSPKHLISFNIYFNDLYPNKTLPYKLKFGKCGVFCKNASHMIFFQTTARHNFKNLTTAAWNVIITLTTVGYGDYYPQTNFGRLIGIITAFWGVTVPLMDCHTTCSVRAFLPYVNLFGMILRRAL